MAFARPKNGVLGLESFWSALMKFIYANVCNCTELIHYFKRDDALHFQARGQNILRMLYFDASKVSAHMQVSKAWLQTAFIESFLGRHEVQAFSCLTLRWCPECIQCGYHSPIHQLKFLTECPEHKVELKDLCEVCRNPIFTLFSKKNYLAPYCCPECGSKLCDLSKFLSIDKDAEVAFRKVAKRLIARQYSGPVLSKHWLKLYAEKDPIYDELKQIWSAWGVLYVEEEGGHMAFNVKPQVEIVKAGKTKGGELESDIQIAKDLYALHLKKIESRISDHKKCVIDITRVAPWVHVGQFIDEARLCPYAMAYIYWRLFWEGRLTAYGLYDESPTLDVGHIEIITSGIRTDSNFGLVQRLYGLEFQGSFESALHEAVKCFQSGHINISVEVLESLQAYWEAFCDGGDDTWSVFCTKNAAQEKFELLLFDNCHYQKNADEVMRISKSRALSVFY